MLRYFRYPCESLTFRLRDEDSRDQVSRGRPRALSLERESEDEKRVERARGVKPCREESRPRPGPVGRGRIARAVRFAEEFVVATSRKPKCSLPCLRPRRRELASSNLINNGSFSLFSLRLLLSPLRGEARTASPHAHVEKNARAHVQVSARSARARARKRDYATYTSARTHAD